MQWTHLPVAGGLNDQDPDLLDKFSYIFAQIDKHEAAESEKQKRESEKARKGTSSRAGGSMRRGRR